MTDARVGEGASRLGPRAPKWWSPWRRWLRAVHRDAGYLIIGLTFVYAVSGLAINHLADWDPNFTQIGSEGALPPGLAPSLTLEADSEQSAKAAAAIVMKTLGRTEAIDSSYAVDSEHLDITLKQSTLYVDLESATYREEGQRPRLLLRAANWLHLNRGKKAWTFIADAYAVLLLYLATSGLFMLPGKRGLVGRGGILALVGAGIPVAYVVLSGGP